MTPPASPGGNVPGLAVRRTATAMLRQVLERRSTLDSLLDPAHGSPHFRALDARDRALVRAILGAALRRRGEIEAALVRCLDRPLPPDSAALSALLHVAAAQLLFLDVPDHATIDLAVTQAGGDKRTGRARGLVNGVLRRMARERQEILAAPDAARTNAPPWLFAGWSAAYGEATALAIARAHVAQPGLDLSVRAEVARWAERLGGVQLPTGTIRLAAAGSVAELPGYAEGAWWVQDAAAALPARLLGDMAGRRVADLCAAPGGKTAQLAAAGAEVTAVDISASRTRRLAANLDRLGLRADIETADVFDWQPGRSFDAVLLDAPCSATGTIRRHPDIQWLKSPEDIAALAVVQAKMLDRAAAFVAPGGTLVFATCSLEPEEGEAHVAPFLARHAAFRLAPIDACEIDGQKHFIMPSGMLRTLPCHAFIAPDASAQSPDAVRGMDGFFAARFRRTPS